MSLSEKKALVLGGGIAGATVALNLADEGVAVTLVEKSQFIGGHGAMLACKATEACQACNGCLVEPRLSRVLTDPRIEIIRGADLSQAKQVKGGWQVKAAVTPPAINPETCIDCGQCLEACPVEPRPAIVRSPLAGDMPGLDIDPALCLAAQGKDCKACVDVCPVSAITLGQAPVEQELAADALVLATGYQPFQAERKTRWGYGVIDNVITGMELEAGLRADSRVLTKSGKLPEKVAFIQCAGSRDFQNLAYCSQVCCAYALRLGRMLKQRFGTEVTIFYMDIQSFGHEFDKFLAEAREELTFVRSIPADVFPGQDGQVDVRYSGENGGEAQAELFDMLVLSVGMAPGADNPDLAAQVGLSLDGHGFMDPAAAEAGGNGGSAPTGLFVAGSMLRPMDVAETVTQATGVALETLRHLEEC